MMKSSKAENIVNRLLGLSSDLRRHITNFTIQCDEKPFVKVLIATKDNFQNIKINSNANIPVTVKLKDISVE